MGKKPPSRGYYSRPDKRWEEISSYTRLRLIAKAFVYAGIGLKDGKYIVDGVGFLFADPILDSGIFGMIDMEPIMNIQKIA